MKNDKFCGQNKTAENKSTFERIYILMINVVKFHENSSKNEEVMAHFTGCTCYDVTPGTIYNKNICIFQSNTKRRVIFNVTHLA